MDWFDPPQHFPIVSHRDSDLPYFVNVFFFLTVTPTHSPFPFSPLTLSSSSSFGHSGHGFPCASHLCSASAVGESTTQGQSGQPCGGRKEWMVDWEKGKR